MKTFYLLFSTFAISAICFGQNAPVDYESGGYGDSWTWTVFENSTNPPLEIVANPFPSGINTSATVAKFTALNAGQPWAGCETMHGQDIGTFDITAQNYIITIMVYKTTISDVGIKLVTNGGASTGEIKVSNTLVNEWEQLTFDFSSHIGNGMTYDQIVIFPDFIARSADDVIYFDNIWGATVCAPTSSQINVTNCYEYTSPSGNVLTNSGIYTDTILNAAGCDSVITIDLTIDTVINTVSQNGATLTADGLVSAYQWLDCGDNYSPIAGEVNQSYTATENGNYALQITTNGCIDTSDCIVISGLGLGLDDLTANESITVYPNPSNGNFTINSETPLKNISVANLTGQIVYSSTIDKNSLTIDLSEMKNGVYILKLEGENVQFTHRIIKQ